MPSASTSLCVECQLIAAKYTCPKCMAKTCSLTCTKAHNAPISTTCASSSTSVPTKTTSSSSSTLTAPKNVSKYVPLSKYTESNMLQDYLFLSSLSRTTAETGREIIRMNLMPPSQASGSSHDNKNHTTQVRLTNQQRQREQLSKQIHYRKYKIMLLPEGMARRKLNQTNWNPKDRKMSFSVQVSFPESVSNSSLEGEYVMHKVVADRSVHQLVLSELEKQCYPNKRDSSKHKERLGNSPGSKVSRYIVSRSHLSGQFGLRLSGQSEDEDVVVLEHLPKDWQIVVPVYSSRLTNESTVKYLEWWTRKRKWEEENPDQAQPDQASPSDVTEHSQQRQRVWGAQATNDVEQIPVTATVLEAESSATQSDSVVGDGAAPSSLISSSLLAMLSHRLGRTAQPPTITSTETEPAGEVQVVPPATPESAICTPSQDKAALKAESYPSTFVHLTQPATTVHELLADAVPDGFSVVEFPILEIRMKSSDGSSPKNEVLITYPPLEIKSDDTDSSDYSDSSEDEDEALAAMPTKMGSPPKSAPKGLIGFLSAYASDSDEDAG